ncbi:MAG TPA: hypothetical protein VHN17_09095 [Steroidobacteraceae bacterium]|nr:hypothetical protein [Steroidobacteraceae bacterium]
MAIKLFWSWQSETPQRTGRILVRDALREAIEQLKIVAEIDEPERDAATIDHDPERISGGVGLVRAILKNIDAADVFVADVTAVGKVGSGADMQPESAGERLINSNVAMELGYALRALSDLKLIVVFNVHYGWQGELPFDVRNREDAITYTLPPNAGRPEIELERKKLTARLVSAIDRCIQEPVPGPDQSAATPSTFNKAVYFQVGEVLAQVGESQGNGASYSYSADTFCYLRLIPVPTLQSALPLATLLDAVGKAPLLSRQPGGAMSGSNSYGAIGFEVGSQPGRGRGKLGASTQLFPSGELWSLSAALVAHERGERPAWIKLPFLASVVFERVFYDNLRALMAFAQHSLSLSPPWQVECGLVGILGLHLGLSPDDIRGPVRKANVSLRRTLKSQDEGAMDKFLLEFFGMLHEAIGSARPVGLHGFPPRRPR